MNSIAARLAVGAGVILTAFVLFTAIALQQSVGKRARAAQYDRLQGLIYGLLGATNTGASGGLLVNEGELPDAKLKQPGSPLVAQITRADQRIIWRSPSLLFDLPVDLPSTIGKWRFERVPLDGGKSFFIMRFTVEWEGDGQTNPRYTFTVAQDTESFDRLIDKFDINLWSLLSIASVLLLLVLYVVLRWGLSPLKHVTRAVGDIERGVRDKLPQNVVRELEPLTNGLNGLLRGERNRQNRYKNALDDLAHSLKTPLSVIRNLAGDANINTRQRDEFNAQVQRMDEIVARHLHSSSIANRSPLSRRINLHTLATRLGSTLDKVYRDKRITFEYRIDKSLSARLNEGDAMEIVGNLMENACKYCRTTVRVEFRCAGKILSMLVEDDGPGFTQNTSTLTERGIRADTQNDGQGIGLAIVADLVKISAGSIALGKSALGGGRVEISLPIV